MQRRIDLLNAHYTVTVTGRPDHRLFKVDSGKPLPVSMISTSNGEPTIKLGDQNVRVEMAMNGEVAYIKAFGRTFTLQIIDPVEQASQEAGIRSNLARAPMPGIVVAIDVAEGEIVIKGQSMMTIESMKILTVIEAPRDGQVGRIHFKPGDSFSKNDALITLTDNEED